MALCWGLKEHLAGCRGAWVMFPALPLSLPAAHSSSLGRVEKGSLPREIQLADARALTAAVSHLKPSLPCWPGPELPVFRPLQFTPTQAPQTLSLHLASSKLPPR